MALSSSGAELHRRNGLEPRGLHVFFVDVDLPLLTSTDNHSAHALWVENQQHNKNLDKLARARAVIHMNMTFKYVTLGNFVLFFAVTNTHMFK